ncbi:MAG: hypothetical protein IJT06_01940 [Selenomonadaceae bacterium]|nr:hypothetical protein [Selenomonadaceae bacterium]
MKKIFTAVLFAFVLISTSLVSAASEPKPVNLSDQTAEEFFFNFNNIALNVLKNNISMVESPTQVETLSDDDNVVFWAMCKLPFDRENTTIFFRSPRNGMQISEIAVLYEPHIVSKATEVYDGTFTNLFTALGLTAEEMQIIFDSVKEDTFDHTIVNCKSIKKFLSIKFHRSENGMREMSISAFVN